MEFFIHVAISSNLHVIFWGLWALSFHLYVISTQPQEKGDQKWLFCIKKNNESLFSDRHRFFFWPVLSVSFLRILYMNIEVIWKSNFTGKNMKYTNDCLRMQKDTHLYCKLKLEWHITFHLLEWQRSKCWSKGRYCLIKLWGGRFSHTFLWTTGEANMGVSMKIKMNMPVDLRIPLLKIYPKEEFSNNW